MSHVDIFDIKSKTFNRQFKDINIVIFLFHQIIRQIWKRAHGF
jgi:hypothetical protein